MGKLHWQMCDWQMYLAAVHAIFPRLGKEKEAAAAAHQTRRILRA